MASSNPNHFNSCPMGSFTISNQKPQAYVPPHRRRADSSSSVDSGYGSSSQIGSESDAGTDKPLALSKARSWRRTSTETLQYEQVHPGQMWLLPNLAEDHKTSKLWPTLVRNNDTGIFGHPIVVLGKTIEEGVELVRFRPCTSMGGEGIPPTKSPAARRNLRLVQHPCFRPHDGTQQLNLEDPRNGFTKPTYVNIQPSQEYQIEAKHIKAWTTESKITISGKRTNEPIQLDAEAIAYLNNL